MQAATRGFLPRAPRALALLALSALAWFAGCASGPGAGRFGSDGPEANPPPDLIKVPDAEPRVEPIRIGGPNKPYDVLGRSYVPITQDTPFTEQGLASWYGRKFNGKRTSSGELYNMYGMTAAHPTLPIPSYARIRNPANGREVVVRINDRGPFHAARIVDLSYTAALKLDLLRGVAPVELQRITFDDIRTGAWRHGSGDTVLAAAPAPAAVGGPTPTAVGTTVPAAMGTTVPTAVGTTVPTALVTPVPTAAPPPTAPPVASVPTTVVASVAATGGDRDPTPTLSDATPGALPAPAEPVADGPTARAFTGPARGWWVQLGAFRAHDGAETFLHRVSVEMDWLSPLLAIFGDASVYRLQAGPYPSRDEARAAAERIRDGLKLVPMIVERR